VGRVVRTPPELQHAYEVLIQLNVLAMSHNMANQTAAQGIRKAALSELGNAVQNLGKVQEKVSMTSAR
jgi:hypothetical protein